MASRNRERVLNFVLAGDAKQLERSFAKGGAAAGRFGKDVDRGYKHGQTAAGRFAKNTDDAHRRVGRSFLGMSKSALKGAAGVTAAYVSISQAKNAISTTQDLAKATAGLSRNLGLNTKEASAWAAVARARGIDNKSLTMSFTTLSRQLEQARGGGEKQIEMFRKLGISQADIRKGSKDFNWILGEVADGLGKLEGGTKRQALAQQTLGRGYQSVLPLFTEGSKSMREQLALAEKYGVTLDKKTLEPVSKLTAAQRELKFAQMGLQIAFTRQTAPALLKVERAALKVLRIMNNPDLTGEEKWAKIEKILAPVADQLSNEILDAIPKIANGVGEQAPKVADAFVDGFMAAEPWGKVAIGGFLLTKLGGWRAFASLGAGGAKRFWDAFKSRRAPALAAPGVSGLGGGGRGSELRGMTPRTPLYVLDVGSGFGKGGGPPIVAPGPGGGAGGGRRFGAGSLVRGAGYVALAANLGLGARDALRGGGSFGDRADRMQAGILNRPGNALGFGDIVSPKQLAGVRRSIGGAFKGGSSIGLREGLELALRHSDPKVRQFVRRWFDPKKVGEQIIKAPGFDQLAQATGPRLRFGDPNRNKQAKQLGDLTVAMAKYKAELKSLPSREGAAAKSGEILRDTHVKLRREQSKITHLKGLAEQIGGLRLRMRSLDRGSDAYRETAEVLRRKQRQLNKSLEDAAPATRKAGGAFGRLLDNTDNITAGIRSMGSTLEAVTNTALRELGADPINFKLSARGERAAGRLARARGGMVQFGEPGGAGFDNIPVTFGDQRVIVGSGEVGAVFTRHQLPEADARFADYGGLEGFLSTVNRPHYAARGGIVQRFARGGMVRVPGDPNTTGGRDRVNAAIAGAVSSWIRRFKIQIGYAYDPGGGHVSPGHNKTGTALDVVPGPGGSWDTLEAGLRAAIRSGKRVIYGTNGIGQAMSNHGRGNHAHVEWGGGGGVGGAGIAPQIEMPSVGGRGAGRAIIVAEGRKIRSAANRYIDRKSAEMGAHGDMSGIGIGASAGQARAWARAGLRLAGASPNAANVNKILTLAQKESGWNPTIVNRTPVGSEHATGFMQMLPSTFRAYAVRGHTNILNPVHNIAASVRYQRARYGGLVTRSPYARGGILASRGYSSRRRPDITGRRGPVRVRPLPGGVLPATRARRRAASELTGLGRRSEMLQSRLETAGQEFSQTERRFGLSQEDLTTAEGRQRAEFEYQELQSGREERRRLLGQQRAAIEGQVSRVRTLLHSTNVQLKTAKGSRREKLLEQARGYSDQLRDLRAQGRQLGFDIGDVELEMREATAAYQQSVAAPPASDQYQQALADIDLQERAGVLTSDQAATARQGVFDRALNGGFGQITDRERWQIMGDMKEAAQQLAQAATQIAEAQQALAEEMKRERERNERIENITGSEAIKFMADHLSGYIGARVNQRIRTPGRGYVASA